MTVDINKIKSEAAKQVAEERADKAKNALVKKYRELEAAKSVVGNIEREIKDLEQDITDGSFAG